MWWLMCLSDGELSITNHIFEARNGARGDDDVHIAHIPAEAGQELGA